MRFQTVNVVDCINATVIGLPLSEADQYSTQWNFRFLTDYYNVAWSDLIQEYGTTTITYVAAVAAMSNINTLLDRIDRFDPRGADRIVKFNEVAEGARNVGAMFESLNVNDTTCTKLLGPRFW